MSDLHLMKDPWIPVARDGLVQRVTVRELLASDAPAVAYGRPDLAAAAVEMITAVVQTVAPPTDAAEWQAWLKDGRVPTEVCDAIERLDERFQVVGAAMAFLQDTSLDTTTPKAIELLDPRRSPANAITEGRALFAFPVPDHRPTLDETALLLYIMQEWTPVRASVLRGAYRGHAPLSTLIRCPTVRETVVANLLPAPRTDPYKWMRWGKPLPSAKNQPHVRHTDPKDPRSALWMMPRAVRVAFHEGQATGFVNGPKRGELQQTVPHPYSPGRVEPKKQKWIASQGRALRGGLPTLLPLRNATAGKADAQPALVVQAFKRVANVNPAFRKSRKVWAYGYHVSNNVDGWNESTVPAEVLDDEQAKRAARLLDATELLFKRFIQAVYTLHRDDCNGDEQKRDLRDHQKAWPFEDWRRRLWAETEPAFWDAVLGDGPEATRHWWQAANATAQEMLAEQVSVAPPAWLAGRARAPALLRAFERKPPASTGIEATS